MSSPSTELLTYAARLVRVVTRAAENDSPASLRLLSQLDELGEQTITDLARADRTSQPTVSAGVRALEQKGWVRRLGNPDDARSSLIGLSDAGRAELERARSRHGLIVDELAARKGVDADALRDAVAVLRTLTER